MTALDQWRDLINTHKSSLVGGDIECLGLEKNMLRGRIKDISITRGNLVITTYWTAFFEPSGRKKWKKDRSAGATVFKFAFDKPFKDSTTRTSAPQQFDDGHVFFTSYWTQVRLYPVGHNNLSPDEVYGLNW